MNVTDDDRKPRFSTPGSVADVFRGRAASQPPTSTGHSTSLLAQLGESGSVSPSVSMVGSGMPWRQPPRYPSLNRAMTIGTGVMHPPPPTRSASFSAPSNGSPGSAFSSSLRADRPFPSTFEDDEDDWVDDVDLRYSSRANGQSSLADMTRSRSQSLAAPNRSLSLSTAGLPIPGTSGMGSSWVESPRASRYGEIGRPRGGMASSPLASSAIPISRTSAGGAFSSSSQVDVTNMSPFRRDVSHIMVDENAALRELWGSMHGGGVPAEHMGGSGTTSRRHSVSIVQPRRGFSGFVSPGGSALDQDDLLGGGNGFSGGFGGSRQMLISDDDLASDLGSLLNLRDGPGPSSSNAGPPSQPASLPIYTGPGRNGMLVTQDQAPLGGGGRYLPMNLERASGRLHSVERRDMSRSPGHSPARPDYRQDTPVQQHMTPTGHQQPQPPQQQSQQGQQQRFQSSDAALAELGRGVPLHAVPSNVPLYIVEFKAGRTDLFYCADPVIDIRVGDLVIVEADRGKDLGKVINDSITPAEVDAFQRQAAAVAAAGEPTSPGGSSAPPSKRDINPKRIYGKAQAHDTQTLAAKMNDEMKALALCQSKVKQKKLPMEVVDAEYQWDRRKLTFYFVAEKRIDFRELVRELFRLYKTRIWMASLQGPTPE